MPYLPYEEPGITVILSLTSFLLLLNGIRYIVDRLLYCGIIGEILIGIIWGLPVGGTSWLSLGSQETIQAFGYLGLIGLVFEGGLSTNITLLRKSVYMSISVATVGLLMPIALSFILLLFPFSSSSGTVYPSPLAGFSAGASLCSTSLGTTFAILSSAGMQRTRAGVVLVGAAMMDDVVGLVMVNIVTTLGNGGMAGWPIGRPIAASFGLLLVTIAVVPFVLSPMWRRLLAYLEFESQPISPEASKSKLQQKTSQLIHKIPPLSFILSTAILIIFVTIASFIDASVLFAAYIAGGVVNFLWPSRGGQPQHERPSAMYELYYKSAMDFILVPFFFASIGFSIPITDMFQGSIVWKGIVYSILMIIAKGLVSLVIYFEYFRKLWYNGRKRTSAPRNTQNIASQPTPNPQSESPRMEQAVADSSVSHPPHSIALLVGFSMIARGEIGFLIASLSQSSGTLTLRHRDGMETQNSGEEIFLVIVWAVVLCTISGPIGVGIIVRRLRGKGTAAYSDWLSE